MKNDRDTRQSLARAAAVAALLAGAVAQDRARAEPSAGCGEAAGSQVSLTVAAGGPQVRQVALDAGEQLDFAATGDQGTALTISLVSGAGAPKTVFSGDTPAGAIFAAPQPDTYTFRLESSAGYAAVSMRCLSSTTAADLQRYFLTRRSERLMMDAPTRARIDAKPAAVAPDKPMPGTLDVDEEGRPRRMAFSMSLSEIAAVGNLDAKQAPASVLDFWFEGRYEAYATAMPDGAAGDGNLGLVYFGTKYMLHPDIMIGALAQFDKTDEAAASEGSNLAASGWMVGPYVSAKLGAGVVFDGRAAWGHADETLSSDLHHSGERQLLQARLSGNRQIEGWTFAPSVALRYFEEATAATPTLSGEAADAAGLGRVDVLPEVSRRYQMNSDTFVEPRFAVGGFWAFEELGQLPQAHEAATDMRLKAEAGVAVGTKEGTSLRATGGVEEGDAEAANVWSGQLQLKVPLNK